MRAHRCVYSKDREAAPVFWAEDQEPMEGRAWWQRWEWMRRKAPAGVGKEGLQPALQHGGSHGKECECTHSRTGRHSGQHIDSEETVPCPFPNDCLPRSSGRAGWPVLGGSQPVKNQEAERCGWGIWLMLEPPYMCWSWLCLHDVHLRSRV